MPLMSPEDWTAIGQGALPGHLGIQILSVAPDRMTARLDVAAHHMALNGFLHAGTAVTIADTLCGYGTVTNLPEGAVGFTTIELKSNHLSTVREGGVFCEAVPHHLGRTTHVWDATVSAEDTGKTICLFRCTQMILWPKN